MIKGAFLENVVLHSGCIGGHKVLTKLPRRYDEHWLLNVCLNGAEFTDEEVNKALSDSGIDFGLLACIERLLTGSWPSDNIKRKLYGASNQQGVGTVC